MHASLLSLLAVAAASPAAAFPAKAPSCPQARAIYVASNGPQNAVVALPVAQNGTLLVGQGTSTSTGGAGASGLTAATGDAAGPDALFSQSAVARAGLSLFAVNPGSHTVTMFAIDPRDPTRLRMVGSPAALPGEFPNTVAASAALQLVCVGMTGAVAGVACAPFSPAAGIGPMDALRPFALNQTTPPAGPLNSVSHVFFSDDDRTLFATVKGDPAVNNTGFLAAFPVEAAAPNGGRGGGPSCFPKAPFPAAVVAATGSTSSPPGTAVLFGASTIPGAPDTLFVTDPSIGGGAVLGVAGASAGAPATTLGRGVVAGQVATCWVAVSPWTGTAFVADVGVNRLVEMSVAAAADVGAGILGSPIDLASPDDADPGLTDLQAAGRFVYALSPGNGSTDAAIAVVDVSARAAVQHASAAALGLSKSSQGMAILV